MKENDFLEKVESVVELFPVLSVDPYYRRSISALYDNLTELPDRLFYLKFIGKGKVVHPLYSRETFRFLAVKSGDRVMALQTEEEFAAIAKHLVDKEGIKKDNILYNPIQFDSESVPYSYSLLIDSVGTLSMLNDEKNQYKFIQCLNRFSGFGCSFILRDWFWFFYVLFKKKKKNHLPKLPTERMAVVREKWTDISEYVHAGGKNALYVKGVKITLERVQKILYIAHSKVHSREEKLLKKIGPNPPKVLWNNPKPGTIVPNTRSSFSTSAFPFLWGISTGPVLFLPGRGIGPVLCGSWTGPLFSGSSTPFFGSIPLKVLFSAPKFLSILRRH